MTKKKGRRMPALPIRRWRSGDSVHEDRVAARDLARAPPVDFDHRVQHLVEIDAVAEERLAQDAFLDAADFLERAVAASVRHGGARLEAVHAERVEGEPQDELGGVLEHARAPEGRSNREPPLGGVEIAADVAHLEDAD